MSFFNIGLWQPSERFGKLAKTTIVTATNGLLLGVAVYGLAKVASLKLGQYLKEARDEEAAKRLIIYHFEQYKEETAALIESLLPEVERIVFQKYDQIEPIMLRLKELKGSDATREAKVDFWNVLKIEVVSRGITVIYAAALVTLLYTIQMAIAGRLMYLRKVFELHNMSASIFLPGLGEDMPGKESPSKEILKSSRYFITVGLDNLHQAIINSVTVAVGKINLTDTLEKDDISLLFAQIRHEIEVASGRSVLEDVLIEPVNGKASILTNMSKAELEKIITSLQFKEILSKYLSLRLESMQKEIFKGNAPALPLIQILPKISKQFHTECTKSNAKFLSTRPELMELVTKVFINYHGSF